MYSIHYKFAVSFPAEVFTRVSVKNELRLLLLAMELDSLFEDYSKRGKLRGDRLVTTKNFDNSKTIPFVSFLNLPYTRLRFKSLFCLKHSEKKHTNRLL